MVLWLHNCQYEYAGPQLLDTLEDSHRNLTQPCLAGAEDCSFALTGAFSTAV
jgi:hypothetical protein